MKKLLTIALLMSSCSEQPKNISAVSAELEKIQVIGYYQSVQSSIIPDESKKSDYPRIDLLVSKEYYDNRINRQKSFASNISDNCQTVFLSKVNRNRCFPIDVSGELSHHEIQTSPFIFKATSYNGDSSSLYIENPAENSEYLNLKVNNRSYCIKAGDTLTVIDTLTTRIDSTYCWEQLIITKQITNFGLLTLTDDRLTIFF